MSLEHRATSYALEDGTAIVASTGALVKPLDVAHSWTAGQHSAQVVLTSSGAALAINLAEGNSFYHDLTEDTTLALPSNIAAGAVWTMIVEANGTHELAYAGNYSFGTGTAPDFSAMSDGDWVALTFVAKSATVIGASYTETY